MRRITILAAAATLLAALAVPASAAAKWVQHNQDIPQHAQIQFTGQTHFEGSEIGGASCQVDATVTLLAGQTTANVTQFGVDLTQPGSTVTSKCSVDAVLQFLGCTDVAAVHVPSLPWTAHAVNKQQVGIVPKTVEYTLHGSFLCPKTIDITEGGVVALNTITTSTWSASQLSGQLLGHGPVTQLVKITGEGTITPSNRFGIT